MTWITSSSYSTLPRTSISRAPMITLRYFSIVSGQTTTFPLWVYGASRFGVPPEINVLGTLIFLIAGLAILAQILWARRSAALDRAAMEVNK